MATKDEKIEALLDSLSRDEKMERMLDSIGGWDVDSMVDWIRNELRDKLDNLDDDQLKDEYALWFDHELDEIEDDEGDNNTKDQVQQCDCEWSVVYQQGCQCGGA